MAESIQRSTVFGQPANRDVPSVFFISLSNVVAFACFDFPVNHTLFSRFLALKPTSVFGYFLPSYSEYSFVARNGTPLPNLMDSARSEERRVGKECRSRW